MASAGRSVTTLLPGAPAPTAYEAEVLADSPAAYWRMDETGTEEFPTDFSGNGRDMTLPVQGGSTPIAGLLTASGETGKGALDFEASLSQYWATNRVPTFSDVFTIDAWVKMEGSGERTIIGQDGGMQLKVDNDGYVTLLHQNATLIAWGSTPLSNGTTYHIAATKNGATTKIYVNGVDVTSLGTNTTVPSGGIIRLGAQQFGEYMDGVADEIAIYGTALSQARIQAHYDAGVPTSADPVDGTVLDLVWDTRAQADGTVLDLTWDTRATINGTVLDLTWDTRATADGVPLDLTWDTRATINGTVLDFLWDLKGAVSGDILDLKWDTRATVDGTVLDFLWDLKGAVSGTVLDLTWDTRTTVDGTVLDLLWDTKGAVSGTVLDLLWDLKGAVSGVPLDLTWDTRATVDGTVLDLVWDLFHAAGAVNGNPLSLVWDTQAHATGVPLDLLWDLRTNAVGDPLDLTWDLRTTATGDALDLLWDMRASALGVPLDLTWDLRAQALGVVLDLIWDLRASVTADPLDLTWDLRIQALGDALDLLWDLSGAVSQSLAAVWDLYGEIDATELDLLWDVYTPLNGALLRLRWDLIAEGVVPSPYNEGILDGVIALYLLDGLLQHTDERGGAPIVPVETGGSPGNLTGAVILQTDNDGVPTRSTTDGVLNG